MSGRVLETVNPAPVPSETEESRADAFKRLANARMNKAIKMIALVGNLSGAQYESTPEQLDAIERALIAQVNATMRRLRKVKTVVDKFEL